MTASSIPEGFNTVSAYLVLRDPQKAIEFYTKAFGAECGKVLRTPDGSMILHAEMRIGNSTVMLSMENPAWNAKSAQTLGGSPVGLHLYVNDVDKSFLRAIDAGCKIAAPLMDAFWGDRFGKVEDPFGLQWGLATHKEDLTEVEIARRAAEWFAATGSAGCPE